MITEDGTEINSKNGKKTVGIHQIRGKHVNRQITKPGKSQSTGQTVRKLPQTANVVSILQIHRP